MGLSIAAITGSPSSHADFRYFVAPESACLDRHPPFSSPGPDFHSALPTPSRKSADGADIFRGLRPYRCHPHRQTSSVPLSRTGPPSGFTAIITGSPPPVLLSSEDFVFYRHHHRCQTSYRYSTEDRHRRLPSSRGCRESLRLRRNDTLQPLQHHISEPVQPSSPAV